MIGQVSKETIAELHDVLEESEQILGGLTSMSASLVLTDRRLVIIREGWRNRSRTGIRTWPLDASFSIQTGVLRGGAGALIIDRERGATSYYVREADWPDALAIIAEARRLSARSR
jgi:hypothetical protein